MKKILHTLLISCFSFSIISCASMSTSTMLLVAGGGGAAYWYKDEIIDVYDDLYADFTKEEVKTGKKKAQVEKTEISTSAIELKPLFVSVGGKGTILTSSDGSKWTKRRSGSKRHLRAVAYGEDALVVVGFSGIVLTSSDGTKWTKRK